jgi:hypothetical protein
VCQTGNQCISFGRYLKLIETFFDKFISFKHTVHTVQRIGSSSNGIIYQVAYERNGFEAFCVLKLSSKTISNVDSLYYEYLVGSYFVNYLNKRFPCFLQTYGLCEITDETLYTDLENDVDHISNIKSKTKFLDKMANFESYLKKSCVKPNSLAILIQHVGNASSFSSHFYKNGQNPLFCMEELPQLLFQIYGPLDTLGESFTHYDLHTENVLIYDLGPTNYIELKYNYGDGVIIEFKTRYICKIIDYGRCYFASEKFNFTSKDIFDKLCELNECNTDVSNRDCGYYKGYANLHPSSTSIRTPSTVPNPSQDLLLLNNCKSDAIIRDSKIFEMPDVYDDDETIPTVKRMLQKLIYDTNSSTKPRTPGLLLGAINNVKDVDMYLKNILQNTGFGFHNCQRFRDVENYMGSLEIDMTSTKRNMRFKI